MTKFVPDYYSLNSEPSRMFYRPLLPDSKIAPLPWQIKTFYFNVGWPLMDNPKRWMKIFYLFASYLQYFLLTFTGLCEFRYVVQYVTEIHMCIEGFLTFLFLVDIAAKMATMLFKQNQTKHFIAEFFHHIYIDEKENSERFSKIHQLLTPCRLYSYGYILALSGYILKPFIQENGLPFKMILPYNHEQPILYVITLLYLNWIGYSLVFFNIGDTFFFATCALHLNTRYEMAAEEIQKNIDDLVARVSSSELAFEFRKRIVRMYKKVAKLNRFSHAFNETYKARTFIMFACSAITFCMLLFEAEALGASMENLKYANWIIAKVTELLIIGALGSTLMQTTDKTSSMYYLSNWEEIIYRSTNRVENIRLLKDINIIMSLQRNPMRLSGFNYFDVSLDTVVTVLRGAFSFYTCFHAVNESSD